MRNEFDAEKLLDKKHIESEIVRLYSTGNYTRKSGDYTAWNAIAHEISTNLTVFGGTLLPGGNMEIEYYDNRDEISEINCKINGLVWDMTMEYAESYGGWDRSQM